MFIGSQEDFKLFKLNFCMVSDPRLPFALYHSCTHQAQILKVRREGYDTFLDQLAEFGKIMHMQLEEIWGAQNHGLRCKKCHSQLFSDPDCKSKADQP